MSSELVQQNTEETTGLMNVSQEKIELIKNTVAKGATNDELEMFLHLANRYRLDPLAKEIWFIKRPKKVKINGEWDYRRLENGEIDYTGVDPIITTSRDGYLKIAQNDPDYEGLISQEIREKDKFLFKPLSNEIDHEIPQVRGRITGAYAVCKRKGREPAIVLVDFNEYMTAAGSSNPVWKNYPSSMIKKVAEVMALKRQFNISGLVTQEEMNADFNLDTHHQKLESIEKPPERKEIAPPPQNQEDVNAEWKRLSRKIKEKRELLGITSEQAKDLFLDELGLEQPPTTWSVDDLKRVIEYLDSLQGEYTDYEEKN